MGELRSVVETSKPYLLMTLSQLSLAVFIALLSSVLGPSSDAISSTILVLYEHLISSPFLSSLALLFQSGKRPRLTFNILLWIFLVGFLQIPLEQLLLTSSLRYITASFQSVVMNTIPVLVFVLAVASRREKFCFWGLNGQAKLWGIVASAAGATVMVVATDPERQDPTRVTGSPAIGGRLVGCVMVGLGVLASASASLLVERVAVRYPADLTLSAMMNISGTLQTAVIAAITERKASSWRIRWSGSMQLLVILYGGIVVTGISYLAQIWCIHKKGPVFGTAFSPLLIVFSFLLEILVFGRSARLQSILGAVLVVGGLYLLLWAKSKDYELQRSIKGSQSPAEPLLLNND